MRKMDYGTKYSRMDQVKFFKGCFPQILLGPFLNTLSHFMSSSEIDLISYLVLEN